MPRLLLELVGYTTPVQVEKQCLLLRLEKPLCLRMLGIVGSLKSFFSIFFETDHTIFYQEMEHMVTSLTFPHNCCN